MKYKAKTFIATWLVQVPLAVGLSLVAIQDTIAQERPPTPKITEMSQSSALEKVQPSPTQKSPVPEATSGGPHEGIKVHGHWTIVVQNPDGSVVSKNEFENSLSAGFSPLLALLTGQFTTLAWEIQVTGSPAICAPGACGTVSVLLAPPTPPIPGADLVLSVIPATSTSPSAFSMTGSIKASSNGQIRQVGTFFHPCGDAQSGQAQNAGKCRFVPIATSNSTPFTSRDLGASPIPILNGQTILITVAISFV